MGRRLVQMKADHSRGRLCHKILNAQACTTSTHEPFLAAEDEPAYPDGENKKEAACFCGLLYGLQCFQDLHGSLPAFYQPTTFTVCVFIPWILTI